MTFNLAEQALNLNGCDIIGRRFQSQTWLYNFDTGWVLCDISVVFFPIPFKSLLQWLLHLYVKFEPIPSSSLPCRCDRSSTCFTWKIDHNSINLYWIPTKLSTEVHFNKPFRCVKFQLDRSKHSHFMDKNTKCVKWRIRRKKQRN